MEISNRYIETGRISACAEREEYIFAEIWVGSAFVGDAKCEELETVKRRSLESVAKEIINVGGGKKVCPVFMCDSCGKNYDTLDWGSTLYLLLSAVKERGNLAGAVIYTKCSYEKMIEDRAKGRFRTIADDKAFEALFDITDVFVTEQPNVYGEGNSFESAFGGEIAKAWAECEAAVRILKMERIFDDLCRGVKSGEVDEKKLKQIETYYDGGQWQKDYEKDEKGLIPQKLKRGVLSEDGVYNLLCDIKQLI